MRIKNNQSGIAHLAILAVIVVVAVIAFVAYRVTQKKDTPGVKATTSASKSTSETNDSSSSQSSSDSTKFLTIKEWGVKFALTGVTTDAYYDTKTSSTIDSMSLRSHSLDSESDCTTTPLSVAGIFRVQKDTVNDQTGKKI